MTAARTQWSNAFRSRLYIDRVRDDDGKVVDLADPARTLERMKSNYALAGERLKLRWRNGVIVRDRDPNETATGRKRTCTEVFLSLLDEREKQGRPVSDKSRSSNYAPKEFALLPAKSRDGYDKGSFTKAMAAMFADGKLELASYKTGGKEAEKIVRRDGSATAQDGSGGYGRLETTREPIPLD